MAKSAHKTGRRTVPFRPASRSWIHIFHPQGVPGMLRFLILTTSTWAMLPIRIALGLISIAHGSQKIFSAFGGKGFEAWLNTPVPLGLTPPKLWLTAAAFSELVGGALILVGLLTR